MTIYGRPTKLLMADWARENLKPDQTFIKDDAVRWFAQHYPKIKGNTVNAPPAGVLEPLTATIQATCDE
jgi:hypothetical protein